MDPNTSPPATADADWIDNREQLDAWLADIDGLLAVDTEFMRRNTYYAQLALIQFGHGERRALVDPLALSIDDALANMDRARAPLWVMHSPSEDLDVMAPLLPGGPAHLFDTQLAAAFCGLGLGMSYRALVEHVTGVHLDKGETRSDWLQRPLTASQRLYATLDVVYLRAIHDHLRRELEDRDRLAWFEHDCEQLKQRASDRGIDPQPQRALRGGAFWSPDKQALLRRVLLWRETTARTLDKPRPWLLQDAQIMALVDERPNNDASLTALTQGQRALRAPQRAELLELLQRGVDDAEIEATAAIPAPLDSEGKRILAAMKQDVHTLAESLDLPPGLLAPRKVLEELIATRDWPQTLHGWRTDLLHDRLMARLPDR
ncbi:ribonuclease D [Oleiagrimonas soli]|uniref:Ribonuclease D n=1 Tax=Oleiagrimonas soli TaxID=1543381 RepID=A0A099CUX2_9GAMM|nr:HRDC domain-containing protein [Oleiagrimonas soli]KGI77559.1 ribonuclease D [Oleiagrimonas soli]MBB6182960.1 ribonuclease D [Oleiagrimonas soli]